MTPTMTFPPVPPGFADRFVADGWRGIERVYGYKTDILLFWIEQSGGDALHARRASAQTCGRRSGGAVNDAKVGE